VQELGSFSRSEAFMIVLEIRIGFLHKISLIRNANTVVIRRILSVLNVLSESKILIAA
jgi:hypothetical protein